VEEQDLYDSKQGCGVVPVERQWLEQAAVEEEKEK
jgi:hypothetical protein